MLKWITAERTSSTLASDGAILQRQLSAYYKAREFTRDRTVLEIGCGEGVGTAILAEDAREIVAIDYSETAIEAAKKACPASAIRFLINRVPPIPSDPDQFDAVVLFQMIEHLSDPRPLIDEVFRVLKTGGTFLVSTVNKDESFTENPFHYHEFDREDLESTLKSVFPTVAFYGLYGDEKYQKYFEMNRDRVDKITKLDIFDLSSRIPPTFRKFLYSVANRAMRASLRISDRELCDGITHQNFIFRENETDGCLDFFVVCIK